MSTVPSALAGLADDLLHAVHEREPVFATLAGFRDLDGRLADHSEAGEAAAATRLRDIVAAARAIDPAGLTAADRVTRAVVEAYAQATLDRLTSRAVEYTVTALYVAPAALLLFGLPMTGIGERAHAQGYLDRLRAVPRLLATVADRHRGGVAAGRPPVRRLVDAAIAHLDRHLDHWSDNPLRRPGGDAGWSADFVPTRDRLVDGDVRAAFLRYRDVLAGEIAEHGRPDDRAGLCWLPDGEATYERLIRAHTTTARTAEDLHRTGLDLIEALHAEYRDVGARVFGPAEPAEMFARLRADPALRWRDAADILDATRAAVTRAEAVAPRWFGRLPGRPCVVAPVPADEAPDAPGGNYSGAALDGSRPATYFVNTDRPGERDRYSAEAVAFHEVVPGHHVQVGLARELTDLPPLRRLAPFDAFAEGWGLYAERLADEMGLYSGDLARLGMLAGDSLRAARLVVDTGLHAYGWRRQRAVDFLLANTPLAPVDVEREIDRYVADPGQALAYMVGRLEIERLRADASRALGERFDVRGFHDAVLANGKVPLGVLAEVVGEWVAAG